MTSRPLGWLGIVRLGLAQSALGAIVMLATSLLNRVMIVEYALPAALPAGLVAWHYAVQLARPAWGHRSDGGRRRTPWIVGGVGALALGALLAVAALPLLASHRLPGALLMIAAFSVLGGGVGAAGTSLLALLASRVDPARRAGAAAITWIMMIAGIVVAAAIAGALIDPFSPRRLALVVAGVAGGAFVLAALAVWGVEGAAEPAGVASRATEPGPPFSAVLRDIWDDADARRFTVFVFLSMLAYSMQELILEPFAGLVFGFSPGESTRLAAVQHGGVLFGMIAVGVGGNAFGGGDAAALRRWIVGGCVGSAAAIGALALAAQAGRGWPLAANVAALGFANGVFAVAAIGTMMALAGGGRRNAAKHGREGVRMGVWGGAQAIAFALGGLTGAIGVDVGRSLIGSTRQTFAIVFAAEGLLFLAAALLAMHHAPGRAFGPLAGERG